MKNVLKPIEAPFPPEVAAILERYPRGKDGYIISLFRVFANSLRFLGSKGVANLLDDESPLTLREREIVILRVTARTDCEYEWGVHVSAFSRAAGLTPAEVAATRLADHEADCWSKPERLLIRCVDELCEHATIGDETYEGFQECWSLEQQLEILALVGNYHTVSFVANCSRLAPEEGAARFPVSSRMPAASRATTAATHHRQL